MSSKRKYTKRSDYWDKFKSHDKPIEDIVKIVASYDTQPETAGDSFYTQESQATQRRAAYGETTLTRKNGIYAKTKKNKYVNIASGLLPYDYGADGVNVREAIELCQKAYANIAIFRNAVDIMAEFSNSPIYLEEKTKSLKSS